MAVVRSLRDGRQRSVSVRLLIVHEDLGLTKAFNSYPALPDLRSTAAGPAHASRHQCCSTPPDHSHMRQHWPTYSEATMTPIALPQAIMRALRDPVPDAKDFTPTKFQPAASKAWFVGHLVKFISADFPRHQFTKRFYGQLIHCFGFIALYDENGFWTEYFPANAGKIEFLQQILSHPCYGDSCHTFSDAEQDIIKRLRRTDVLGLYWQRLCIEQDVAERAELARLMARYGQDTPTVDPGTLRTVLLPMNRPDSIRTARRRDDNGQLALGFG